MTLIAIDKDALAILIAQVQSGIIHRDITARELQTLAEAAPPACPMPVAERLAQELRRGHCRSCKPAGMWPIFEAKAKATKCARCVALEAFEETKGAK